ncbi:peptidoglycan/xylan/chitin deacetylase (PgdA/CDA1 family) [Alkalibaculum bacchi]|uniref:Peptidoglycan/xylan/chitin deacetylase (PgdA/CDA1 family) n=1 Tax=Alkalibaculum bacchi TaxID=645887 RepID=A0A366IDK8_9FIRM|nr:polysaccharide deacetylase family protein [Alkalibaculum bacchi]RBP67332.1 peptidoglycan/xylan/chitin deacetylase (PgdA/CDA1 family) [Alkalibaculum bacchi]
MRHKKSKLHSLVAFSILGIIILSVIIFNRDPVISTNKTITNNSVKAQTAYPGVDIITEIHDERMYHIAIHYPKFKDESLNEQIQKYVSSSKKKFFDEVAQKKKYLNEFPASLYILFDIHPVAQDVYSIVFHVESYAMGANGFQGSKVFIVDVNENSIIQQTEILVDNEQNRNKLYTLLLDEFEKSEEYKPYFFEEELKKWIEDENNRFSHMFIRDHSIVFKFDKYVVTAGAAGSPEISIPLQKVRNLLTDEWQKKLNLIEVDSKIDKPNGCATAEKDLKESESPGKRQVALTFDDGPHEINTLKILELLDKHNAKATFFMLGNRVDFYPGIAKEISKRGHELGNHTWNHKNLKVLNEEEIHKEIRMTRDAILKATEKEPTVFRPPYGGINDRVYNTTSLPLVLWTVDTKDWKTRNARKVLSEVKKNVEDGSIVLMHDIHSSTVEAVDLVLQYLEAEDYECVTVSELDIE